MDREIVIKLPEEVIELAKSSPSYYPMFHFGKIWRAIVNGTPIPKGHGDLIDRDELKKHKYHDNDRFENAVAVAQIDWAPTIIEADKEMEKK